MAVLVVKHSYRDAVTHVLVAQGFVTRTQAGEIEQDESADFALQPGQWQWDGSAWVAYAPPPEPDKDAFEVSLHDIFPDQSFFAFVRAFDVLAPSWLFLDAIRRGTWPQVQGLIQLALQGQAITQEQYAAIKAAAAAHHIPVSL